MARRTGVRWLQPPRVLADALGRYADRVPLAVETVAQRMALLMQNDARQHAPWTDRTGAARRGLFGATERDMARRLVTVYLSHGPDVSYGRWLELANQGKHSIVMQTLLKHLPQIKADLDAIFR